MYQEDICLIGVYAPNGFQQLFWQDIFSHVGSEQEIIVLGDFNVVLDTRLDRSMVTGMLELPEQFRKYMENLGLREIWRGKE